MVDVKGKPSNGLRRSFVLSLVVAGAVLTAWSAGLHLYLYGDYFHRIHTIGPLFIAQGVVGILMAAGILIFRKAYVALAGAALLTATIGGLLISIWNGLFGYHERLAAPYVTESLIVEGIGAVVLVLAAAVISLPLNAPRPTRRITVEKIL